MAVKERTTGVYRNTTRRQRLPMFSPYLEGTRVRRTDWPETGFTGTGLDLVGKTQLPGSPSGAEGVECGFGRRVAPVGPLGKASLEIGHGFLHRHSLVDG